MSTMRSPFHLLLLAASFLFGPASAQTPAQLRQICEDTALRTTLLGAVQGSRRAELEVEIEERCAQIDLPTRPIHDTADASREASHTDWVMDARYSRDGRMIVSASSDGTVGLWNVESGRLVRRIKVAEDYVWNGRSERGRAQYARFIGDGAWIATAAWFSPVRIFDVASGQAVATLPTASIRKSPLPAVIAASGAGLVLVDGFDGAVEAFDAATQVVRYRLPGHGENVRSIAISEAGGIIATAGSRTPASARGRARPVVHIWRLDTGEMAGEFFPEGASSITTLTFSRDGAQLAVGIGGRVHIHSVADWSVTRTLLVHPVFTVFDVAFTADGAGLITCRSHPMLWDIASGKKVRHFGPFSDLCHSVDVSPDGRFAVTTSMGSDLRVWEIGSGTFHRRMGNRTPPPR